MAKCKIEWDESIDCLIGKVGGLSILEVTGTDSSFFGYTVWEYDELECATDFEREKKRLEDHFFEWLGKISYRVMPGEITYVDDGGKNGDTIRESGKKHLDTLPEGEPCVSMVVHKGEVYVATTRGVYIMREYLEDHGMKKVKRFKPIEFIPKEEG